MDDLKRGLLSIALTVGGLMGLQPFSDPAKADAAEDSTASIYDASAQSNLTVFTYQIRYFVRGAVVHEEQWETVAPNPSYAASYASNHCMATSQRLRERGLDIDRTSAVVTSTRPY